jgi:hypothetical protein
MKINMEALAGVSAAADAVIHSLELALSIEQEPPLASH